MRTKGDGSRKASGLLSFLTADATGLSSRTRWALAIGCGLSVGNLYYLQPLLARVALDFGVSEGLAGLASTLAQVGYALGMLFVVPLGDVRERRSLVVAMLGVSVLLALATAFAPTFPLLLIASLGLGIATCSPQILVPFAAALAPEKDRGRVIGFVMAGLLLGILLARTFSGFVGGALGWRTVYLIAAGLAVLLAVALRLLLPKGEPSATVRYRDLMRSIITLAREEPVLRESAVYGALVFAAFSAFWTTLAFYLRTKGLGPEATGLFGLVGAAGAFTAPAAGRLADRGGPRTTILFGIAGVLVSFVILLQGSIPALIVGVLLLDVGVQATHVSNQSRFYALRPESRSRMNTFYMTLYFVGGSAGSAVGAGAWSVARWPGVCAFGILCAVLAAAVWRRTARR